MFPLNSGLATANYPLTIDAGYTGLRLSSDVVMVCTIAPNQFPNSPGQTTNSPLKKRQAWPGVPKATRRQQCQMPVTLPTFPGSSPYTEFSRQRGKYLNSLKLLNLLINRNRNVLSQLTSYRYKPVMPARKEENNRVNDILLKRTIIYKGMCVCIGKMTALHF